jgi:phage terminase large subunit
LCRSTSIQSQSEIKQDEELIVNIKIPTAYRFLDKPSRFKVIASGRGAAGSHSICRTLIKRSLLKKERILCTREIQRSIKDSVHKLLCDIIKEYGLDEYFTVTQNSIVSVNGSEFLFCGLWQNVAEVKSKEGITICYAEEAQRVSDESWDYLIPTIREPDSEIWVKFNPDSETDPTYKRFVTNKPNNCVLVRTTYRDNPFFPEVLRLECEWCKNTDYDKYLWIWEGNTRKISDALIFKGKFVEEDFDSPGVEVKRFFGADWGFSQDPTVLVSSFIRKNTLYIEHEAWGIGVELDETAQLFDSVPGSRLNYIMADNSRPETISHIRNRGFRIDAADKWGGSVEDGIAFMKSFEKIVIHPRCKHTLEEFKLYSYKMDKLTNEPLPVIVDKNNHCCDAIRYSLGALIKQGGSAALLDSKPKAQAVSHGYRAERF